VLLVSVAENVGIVPEIGTLPASFNVIVMVEVVKPSAVMDEVPVIVECAVEAAPATKTTVPPVIATGVTNESVFVSGCVEASVQVETPEAFELEHVP
jgi:hypothetical protein